MNQSARKKTLQGRVIASPMQKTAVVAVTRYVRHPRYGKYRRVTKRYKVHDPDNAAVPGDTVRIESCRPVSREKRFRLLQNSV